MRDSTIIFNRFVIQLLVIMFLVEFIKGALLITILPVYMSTFLGLSTFIIGWALALQYIGDNLFRSPIGWLIDQIGYRYSMVIGMLITFGAVIMLATLTHVGWIIMACALLGIGSSPLWPCVITGTTEVAGERARGTIMSIIYMAWISGVGLGPIFINFVVHGSYRAAFQMLIVMMVVVILVTIFLPSHTGTQGSMTEIRKPSIMMSLVKHNNKWAAIRQYFYEVKTSLTMSRLMFPAMFLQTLALGILIPVLTLYVRTVLDFTAVQYSYLLMTGGGAAIILLIPVGWLVDKWGTSWFLHIGFALSSSVLLFLPFVRNLSLLFTMVALLGIGYALVIPAWNALIAEAVPKEKRGAVWGFFLTIGGLGMIVGPIASGLLWDTIGPSAPFITSGLMLFILLIVHIFISSRKKDVVR